MQFTATIRKMLNIFLMVFLPLVLTTFRAEAGIFDLFKKDSCKQYSDYTCKQLENSSYNVYFYWPNDKEEYLGQSYSLSGCGDTAYDFAYRKNISNKNWGYICCLITKNSGCAEKHR